MPTGYTAAISDGISFRQFALNCARAFGATIEMRDEPLGAPLEKCFSSSDVKYHSRLLNEAQSRLQELQAMTLEQIEKEAQEDYSNRKKRHDREMARIEKLRGQYNAMLKKIEEWVPPTNEHTSVKKFMREQIETRIQSDCYELSDIGPLNADAWHKEQLEIALGDIEYHTRQLKKTDQRNLERIEWIKLFVDSLPSE